MKLWQIILFSFLIAFLGWGFYGLRQERASVEAEVSELLSRVDALKKENTELKSDIEYFQNPENLVKELKSQFNYRAPDEKMFILVPSGPSTTPTATPTSTQQ